MSRQKIKSCARHSSRVYNMKNFIITTVMALLIGAFAFTANAQDRKTKPAVKSRAKTEKQANQENKGQNLKIRNESSIKAPKNAEQTLELKIEADAKAKAEAEKKAIKENSDLLVEFVKAVDNCEIEHNKNNDNKFSQYLEEALRLSTKINTKMLTDEQKATFDENKTKLNVFLKG